MTQRKAKKTAHTPKRRSAKKTKSRAKATRGYDIHAGKPKSMNSAGSAKGSLTSRGCTSQVTSSPFSFRPHGHAAVAAWHRARQRPSGTELCTRYLVVE
jgi:hypothetical protein